MLEIKDSKNLIVDDSEMPVNKGLLLGSLSLDVELGEQITVGELVHFFYDISEFINDYFVEEYESVRSLISMGKFISPALNIKMQQDIEENDEVICLNNTFELVLPKEGEKGSLEVKDLIVKLDNALIDENELLKNKQKASFKLLDVLEFIFVDFIYMLRNDPVLQ